MKSILKLCLVPGKVSFVSASRVNDSSLNISWGAIEAANGNLTHYLVWVNSTSDGHRRLVDISRPRRLIVSGLSKSLFVYRSKHVQGQSILVKCDL